MLIFEIVIGYPPFYDDDKVLMYKNITELRYYMPRKMSPVSHTFVSLPKKWVSSDGGPDEDKRL